VNGIVTAVCRSPTHSFSKPMADRITLIAALGIEGDVHQGATSKHLARLVRFGNAPNLRQVHLIHAELFDELRSLGFNLWAGMMGENITTRCIDLLGLPTGARHPCRKLNQLQPGLMKATLARDRDGRLVRKAGIMGIVAPTGEITEGDAIEIELPTRPHRPLVPV